MRVYLADEVGIAIHTRNLDPNRGERAIFERPVNRDNLIFRRRPGKIPSGCDGSACRGIRQAKRERLAGVRIRGRSNS